jgi:hypothetical protein
VSATVPFVVGQWVRGARLYGRQRELAAALDPACPRCWIVGLRRVGKTSLLREAERRAIAAGALAVYWDLQGAENARELASGLAAALADAGEALAAHGVDAQAVTRAEASATLESLRRELAGRGVRPLLLLDEADELGPLARREERLVAALWRELLAAETRVALATSPRFAAELAGDAGGELSAGLGRPLLLGALDDDAARALLRQDQLPPAARPRFEAATVEALRAAAGNHPMLLQLLGRRCLELGDPAAAVAQAAADRTLHHLFAADLDLLSCDERELLQRVARGEGIGDAEVEPAARRLLSLGLMRRGCDGVTTVASELLAAWLRAASSSVARRETKAARQG